MPVINKDGYSVVPYTVIEVALEEYIPNGIDMEVVRKCIREALYAGGIFKKCDVVEVSIVEQGFIPYSQWEHKDEESIVHG